MKFTVRFKHTNRGFHYCEFRDLYGSECSLQMSSLAGQRAIWFGVDRDFDTRSADGGHRMHLTQDMVRALLPALQLFAETGELPEEESP